MITLRNKIAQMLIMGFSGCEIQDKSPVAQWLAEDGLGGVLLFDKDLTTGLYGKNVKTQGQIKQLIHSLNHFSSLAFPEDQNIPLITALDYEGGAVDRLKHVEGCMTTMPAMEMAKLSNQAFAEEVEQMATTLKNLGFNLNFAPVVDLHLNAEEGIIGRLGRSFSVDPDEVTRLANQFVEIFSRFGIACSYKHFPGHGSAVGDTHEGFVDVTDTYQSNELVPYAKLLKDKQHPVMVMTAHVVNKNLDPSGLPATLSYEILTNLLRKVIGFDGVIISDDLQMQAIASHYSLEESLLLTINAGADMLIFGNQLGSHNAPQIIDIIEQLVMQQKISTQRIDEAFRRIMRLKQQIHCQELVDG
ncbi:MAG: glycoside hydrolase family 3 protein [Legionella sp.]|nr:MAG: glycoside hydrolase family 3 protein [Legionella sp.]